MIDFTTSVLIGAIVSLLTQGIKMLKAKYTFLNEYFTIAVAVVLSLISASVFYMIKSPFWETFGQILTVAGAIYTFLIARFEKA